MVRPVNTVLLLTVFITVLCQLTVAAPAATDSALSGNSTSSGVSAALNNSSTTPAPVSSTVVTILNPVTAAGNLVTPDSSTVKNDNSTVKNLVTVPVSSGPVEYYKTKYDHVDVETILNNKRMVHYYSKCLLNEGPCSPDGAEFKKILPDAIQTNCIKCTEKQKSVTIRAVKRLMKEYPKVWARLAKEWDPNDVFVKKFLATWGNWEYQPLPTPTTGIFDRFGDDEDDTQKNSSPTNILFNIPPLPSIPPQIIDTMEPIANNIGAGFTATVSFGNRFVSNVIKGIGAVGNRVVETGAQIADVIVKNLARPL